MQIAEKMVIYFGRSILLTNNLFFIEYLFMNTTKIIN